MKFFRKLRQRFLTENKVSKYLLYAIGEIILVLIGILLALQINDWKQNKSNKRTIGLHINAILDETKENIGELNAVIQSIQNFSRNGERLRELYEAKDFTNPLLGELSYVLYNNDVFIPSLSSFENLKNSDIYALIDNFAVKKSLGEAYNTFDKIKMAEEIDIIPKKAFYSDYLLPNGFLLPTMKKSASFYDNPYFGNMIWTVGQTNELIEFEAKKSLIAMRELEDVLKNYYKNLDIGPLNERTNILEYIQNGTPPNEIVSLVKKQDPNNPDILISEDVLNAYGYYLVNEKKI